MDNEPIVVGVDGSDAGRAAIDLAVTEARLHRRPLRLVHAFVWPILGVYTGPSPEGPPDGGLAADAERLLAESLDHARRAGPDLTVTGEIVTGAAAPVLLDEADRAWLLVLGSRGLGGFVGLLVGSVTVQVASHVRRPLLVARGRRRDDGPVVVGVDGPASAAAVEFAFAEAEARGAELVAVHAWYGDLPEEVEEKLPLIYDAADVTEALRARLSEWVAEARGRHPGVRAREEVRNGRPAKTLVEASREAQLVVVGARGRGGFAGLLLGSVSQALLHHAECPVAVVRGPGA
ncbi:MAG: universal stress protein [Micromonosporaceae bacterium]|jgi:nucleotide-binding universal stress UspA family protein